MSIYKIAERGESEYHIVAHQYEDEAVRYAASELQKYLLLSTGAVVPYFSDRCPERGPEIRVGQYVRGEEYINAGDAEEGFKIFGRGDNIFIAGNTPRGTLYGVYYFLERFCGFSCFTKDVEKVEKLETLEIELDEIVKAPDFEFRDTYFRFAFDGDFCVKNRSNTSLGDVSRAKGGRMKWFNFHHSFNDLVPDTKYFDTHPEYFSEIGGERVKDSQLCLTNPEVFEIALATLRRWIRENPECRVFSVAQNDNVRRCTCKKCREVEEREGSPAGLIIDFVNKLADAIKDEYPHILLHTFAYQYSLPAPKYAVARDNVIVRICSISCRFDKPFSELAKEGSEAELEFVSALTDWKDHAKRLYVWDYAVNFRNYCQPFVHLRVLKENVKLFKKLGIMGVLQQGNFAYGGGAALDELKSYMISRLLWDTDTDVDYEIKRFCRAVFGRAGEKMEEYVHLAMNACESAPLTIYQNPDAEYITDEFINKADAIFAEAISLAENEVIRKRVEREYLSVRFLKIARMPLGEAGRDELIDEFFEDVKSHGITEIRERRPHSLTKRIMKESPCMHEHSGYKLYYIMQ